MKIQELSIKKTVDLISQKKLSVHELTQYYIERIQKLDSLLNSYISVNERALDEAKQLDEKIIKGELKNNKLLGLPIGLKDMFCTQGIKTTAASKMLSEFIPPYDATVTERLKKQGAIILGKLNQDEFAMGSSNETSFFGSVKNPWNTNYVPGGSSGGSAAAQAAGLAMATLGTDTGGSIRQPASFCGVVGVKPTYGRVSRYGIISYASSLDQAGPMCKTVEDAALLLEVISGKDPLDTTTSDRPVAPWSENLSSDVRGLRVGVLKDFVTEQLHPEVQKHFSEAVGLLQKQGAKILAISIPLVEYGVPVYYLIASSEASSNLSRYDGVKYGHRAEFKNLSAISLEKFYSKSRAEGFGKEVQRRIMLGTYCLSSGYYEAYYNKASQVRNLIRAQYLEAFKNCDIILSPVTTAPAFKLGEKITDPLAMYLNDIFTTTINLAGLPAMSVPFGLSQGGLPIGVQIIGAHFDEQRMLNVGLALEQNAPSQGAKPHVI